MLKNSLAGAGGTADYTWIGFFRQKACTGLLVRGMSATMAACPPGCPHRGGGA